MPFLVIESAKKEYRSLLTSSAMNNPPHAWAADVRVYTLGDETVAPFRLNPFELLPGVRVEAHIARLQTCFEAALPPIGPLSSILEEALIKVYHQKQWLMTEVGPPNLNGKQAFPTMSDFSSTLETIVEKRRYSPEITSNISAAILGRIRPLTKAMQGSKGDMLDTPRSSPGAEQLLEHPTVLELNDLNLETKALVAMFLLVFVREYRERRSGKKGLQHVTVVEEAHNVLENVNPSSGAEGGASDVRYKAVQAFCALLTEVRSLGEGLIIADQSPVKLAADAIRNTNVQIVHQIRDARDRQLIADTMIMTREQQDYLATLDQGFAGVFYTGLQRSTFIKIDDVPDMGSPSDQEVKRLMQKSIGNITSPGRPYRGCKLCGDYIACSYRLPVEQLLRQEPELLGLTKGAIVSDESEETSLQVTAPMIRHLMRKLGSDGSEQRDLAWCLLLHVRQQMPKERRPEFSRSFEPSIVRFRKIRLQVTLALKQRSNLARS